MNAIESVPPADAIETVAVRLRVNGTNYGLRLDPRTSLLNLLREKQPARLIDINRPELTQIAERDGGLRLGALAKNSDTANHRLVRERYPLVTQAILAGASAQLRNAATNGGNLMQRTRCYYFYGALKGFSRIHPIFGTSPLCIATHPSDMCVALAALDAVVQVEGPQGPRSIPFAEFHRLPAETPQIDTNLRRDELITAIDLPATASAFADHSYYLKVRDRASYAFALVSVAAALDIRNGVIQGARVAMGGVAHKPWRATKAESALKGQRAEERIFRSAADAEMQTALGTEHNRFKIELGRRAIVRALTIAADSGSTTNHRHP